MNTTIGKFYEDFLALLPLSGTTKDNDLYNYLMVYFETKKSNLKTIISITTDGVPAIVGTHQGLV